jgi:hypothetical protein
MKVMCELGDFCAWMVVCGSDDKQFEKLVSH